MRCKKHVFMGDKDGVRCLKCGYTMTRDEYVKTLRKEDKNEELRKHDSVSDDLVSEPKNTSL